MCLKMMFEREVQL